MERAYFSPAVTKWPPVNLARICIQHICMSISSSSSQISSQSFWDQRGENSAVPHGD